MNNYLVTFYPESDLNSKFAVSFRKKLEEISPNKFVQIFPFQVAIQSALSLTQLKDELIGVESSQRISIIKFDELFTNEARSTNLLNKYDY